ncbi:MAG: anthranilate synthase component I [Planctomycetes bacterium]|nr:anthranilate synthase component I [Planctomycetota bacterium]
MATNTCRPDFVQFQELAAEHNRVPLVATLVCDDLTPVSAFARLEADSPRAFLLESVVGGEKIARYSFLGADPALTFAQRRETAEITDHARGTAETAPEADPLGRVERCLQGYRTAVLPGLPRFLGGAVGYASYDTVRYYEHLPDAPPDDRHLPDLLFDIYEALVIFDHVHKTVLVVAHADVGEARDSAKLRAAYERAQERIEALIGRISQSRTMAPVRIALPAEPLERYTSNFPRAEFERAVAGCQEYIRAGDIFQVVISQRLLVETAASPFDVYRALRVINPSPFMFFLKSPDVTVVGASPEIMCRVEDGVVTNRPLAGTRRRGKTEEEDRRLRAELLADPKERAEHVMLVDLGRNDVGRVAKPGSVRLSDVMSVEYYSHVMHICSNITGELAEGRTAFDALRAALPVGTVSGAPKVRAMEIIDEYEPTRRGPYAGAVGYVDFAGNMDTCIALRTLVMQPGPDGGQRAYVQVGAGVVADSVPAQEYEETLNKARGMLTALNVAETCFQEQL